MCIRDSDEADRTGQRARLHTGRAERRADPGLMDLDRAERRLHVHQRVARDARVLRGHRDAPGAVSYTHLDVYKRQRAR